jgi:hypothetical protein
MDAGVAGLGDAGVLGCSVASGAATGLVGSGPAGMSPGFGTPLVGNAPGPTISVGVVIDVVPSAPSLSAPAHDASDEPAARTSQ